jgi:hypothetical protein
MRWWHHVTHNIDWAEKLAAEGSDSGSALQRCTYAGRPFGDEVFLKEMSQRFGRYWVRGRPPKQPMAAHVDEPNTQSSFFEP